MPQSERNSTPRFSGIRANQQPNFGGSKVEYSYRELLGKTEFSYPPPVTVNSFISLRLRRKCQRRMTGQPCLMCIAQADGARARIEVDDRCTRVILNLSCCQSTMKIRPLPNRREHGTGLWDRDFFCLIYPASCCHRMPRKTFLSSRGYRATIEKSLSITHSRDRRPSRDPALQRL